MAYPELFVRCGKIIEMTLHLKWSRLTDEKLLNLRICDLPLRLEGTPVMRRIRYLYRELKAQGIPFRPHIWLSDEFFTPDGVPGFAVPFYLAHPRLMRLERKQMLEVEGGTGPECMRILRHEAGHALDNAYRLHWKSSWRKMFGPLSTRYPDSYRPNPISRNFVLHLGYWYAQAHPLEDYAETFAVWLRPGARWQSRYRGWTALRKLEYVDQLMKEIAGTKPKNRLRTKVDTLSELKITLGDYYKKKRKLYSYEYPSLYDKDLVRIFSRDHRYAARATAASFLRRYRTEFCRSIAEGTGVHTYTIAHILKSMVDRCKELRLRLSASQSETKHQTMVMLTVHTMNIVYSGHYRYHYGL